MTTIYLIRHAQAMGNQEGRFQGSIDKDLSEKGLAQLELLAQRCREFGAVHIYTSLLIRAKKTAEAVNRYLNVPLTLVPDLREIDMGDWEGVKYEETGDRWPEETRLWKERSHLFAAPGGESHRQVYDRMSAVLTDIASRHKDQTVIAVSHGAAIAAALAWSAGGLERRGEFAILYNTALCRIDIDGGGAPRLVFFNDITHLPPVLT